MARIKIIHSFCVYCNKPVEYPTQSDVEYVKTRRKSEILFHHECYKRYSKIGFIAGGLENEQCRVSRTDSGRT